MVTMANGAVAVWACTNGKLLRAFNGYSNNATCVDLSGGIGDLIAVGSKTGTVRLWKWKDSPQQVVHMSEVEGEITDDEDALVDTVSLVGHHGRVLAVKFAPQDGGDKRLLTVGADGTARVWDVATRKQIMVTQVSRRGPGDKGSVGCAAWSPDGQRFLASDGVGTVLASLCSP